MKKPFSRDALKTIIDLISEVREQCPDDPGDSYYLQGWLDACEKIVAEINKRASE